MSVFFLQEPAGGDGQTGEQSEEVWLCDAPAAHRVPPVHRREPQQGPAGRQHQVQCTEGTTHKNLIIQFSSDQQKNMPFYIVCTTSQKFGFFFLHFFSFLPRCTFTSGSLMSLLTSIMTRGKQKSSNLSIVPSFHPKVEPASGADLRAAEEQQSPAGPVAAQQVAVQPVCHGGPQAGGTRRPPAEERHRRGHDGGGERRLDEGLQRE